MNTFKVAVLASLTLAAAAPVLAQPGAPPSAASPLADAGPYAGASRTDFYHPDSRIKQLQAEIQQGALAGSEARHALAQLTAIQQDLKYRIARHNGDLRDWDRELINQKLDALVKQYPALRA